MRGRRRKNAVCFPTPPLLSAPPRGAQLGRPLFDPDFGPGAERLAQDQDMAGQEQQRQEDGLEQGPGQENLPGLANGAAGGGGGAAG